MNKNQLYHIIEWGVALAAIAYLVWRLATYDDYASVRAALEQMDWPQWTALVVCVLLMPVNMALEAWRWRTLMNDANGANDEMMNWREAQRQVYYSKLAGVITPWRLGEYPARGVLMAREKPNPDNVLRTATGSPIEQSSSPVKGREKGSLWARVLSMGAVGSATMTAAIVLAGVVALVFSPQVLSYLGDSYLYALAAVAVVLGGLMLLMPKALRKYAEVNQGLMLRSTMQSLVRLACWCVQLALVLYALGAVTGDGLWVTGDGLLGTGLQCLVYYLLVTITPNVPVVEVGVRGAWAIFVFGSVQAGLAGVLLWVINTLLPCLVWPFLRKK